MDVTMKLELNNGKYNNRLGRNINTLRNNHEYVYIEKEWKKRILQN